MPAEPHKNSRQRYRTLLEPHASKDEANEALAKFYEAVDALRDTYKIPDVVVVAGISVTYPDGREGQPLSAAQFGDVDRSEILAAYALGRFQAERREQVNKLAAG